MTPNEPVRNPDGTHQGGTVPGWQNDDRPDTAEVVRNPDGTHNGGNIGAEGAHTFDPLDPNIGIDEHPEGVDPLPVIPQPHGFDAHPQIGEPATTPAQDAVAEGDTGSPPQTGLAGTPTEFDTPTENAFDDGEQ